MFVLFYNQQSYKGIDLKFNVYVTVVFQTQLSHLNTFRPAVVALIVAVTIYMDIIEENKASKNLHLTNGDFTRKQKVEWMNPIGRM